VELYFAEILAFIQTYKNNLNNKLFTCKTSAYQTLGVVALNVNVQPDKFATASVLAAAQTATHSSTPYEL